VDVLSSGLLRFRDAQPVQRADGSWWVTAPGEGDPTLPRGVHAEPDYSDDPAPTVLRETRHEVYEHLSLTATLADEAAAEHLAAHVRNYGIPQLCGAHGLPVWHDGRTTSRGGSERAGCRYGEFTGPDGSMTPAVSLEHVVSMVTSLDAIGELHRHLVDMRTRPRRQVTEDVLRWPVQGPWLRQAAMGLLDGEASKGGPWSETARRLVSESLDRALRQSGMYLGMVWNRQTRPELANHAQSSVSLYVLDVIEHLGAERDRTYVCDVCRMPFTPKRAPRAGDGLFCRREECQRERTRRNVARSRARNGS
jgi:hypothetical protein